MNDFNSGIINLTEKHMVSIINAATSKILFMAPGLSVTVAEALAEQWVRLGTQGVHIILDVDAEVCRLGYGDPKALNILQEVSKKTGAAIRQQQGVRIGLLVTDNETLVFTPTAQIVESPSTEPSQPNAIHLNFVPESVARETGLEPNSSQECKVGTTEVSADTFKKVATELAANPPVKFDISQKVRVFNARFEFVEFELNGCSIAQKTVPIPSDLVGLGRNPKTQKQLHSTFKLIDTDNKHLSGKEVRKLKDTIAKRFLISLTGYGTVVLRSNKAEFEKAVEKLKAEVKALQQKLEKDLQVAIDKNRKALLTALTPGVKKNPPDRCTKYFGPSPSREDIQLWLDGELTGLFGKASDYIEQMEVSVVFKGVTYESLNDAKFMKVAQNALPMMKDFHEEYDTAKAVQENLFS